MQAVKVLQQEGCTQFELTSDLLRNLYKYELTPAAKLVLLELTTHLNETRNGSVVFPSVQYISEVLGIGLTATKKAINDLVKQGLIIKSKRSKIRGNYNKYVLTLKIRKTTSIRSENELIKRSHSDLFLLTTNKREKIKQQTCEGGNVYSEEDDILRKYAEKHGARNIQAYINKLKETKSAENIIKEWKRKNVTTAVPTVLQTKKQLEIYQKYKEEAVLPETCAAWVELGKKLGIRK